MHVVRRTTASVVVVVAACLLANASGSASAFVSKTSERAAAKSGLIVMADLGAGWKQSAYHSDSSDSRALVRTIPACRSLGRVIDVLSSGTTKTKAQSPSFSQAGIQVDNSVTIVGSADVAQRLFASLSTPAFVNCFQKVGDRSLALLMKKDPKTARQIASATVNVVPRTVTLPADEATGIEMTIEITTTTGQTVREVLDLDAARVDSALVTYSTQYGPDATTALPGSMLAPSLQRLSASLTSTPA